METGGLFVWGFLPSEAGYPRKVAGAYNNDAGRAFIRKEYLEAQQTRLYENVLVMYFDMRLSPTVRFLPEQEILSW